VRGTWRAGSAGGPRRRRVRRRRYTDSTHAISRLTDDSKSQLALQYAHSIRDAAPQTFVFWVHASTQARFEEAYKDIANRLELPGRDDPKANVLRLVHDWLRDEANGRWVMVIDNVDDIETFFLSRKRQRQHQGDQADASAQIPLATYLPQSRNGTILVTSRSQDAATRLVGGYNRTKGVLAMDESEGLQLLRNKLQDPPVEESAVDLLRALDCIPLAVVQAAAYINRRGRMTVAGYVAEFRKDSKKRESLLNWDAGELRRDESASNSVVTTWQMSFEQIQRERQSAADLLSLMSFFNPQGIPESVLRTARTAVLEDGEDLDSAFNKDLDTLRAYSLVSMTADSDTCEMHAIVQFCTRVWLSSCSNVEQWEQLFVALLAQGLPNGEYENWPKCQQLLPHVEPLFSTQPASEEASMAWAHVLTNAAWYLWMSGSYSVAQQVAAKAVATREKALGRADYRTLTSISVLAVVLDAQGKYGEAETLQRRALEGWKKRLGEDHPDTFIGLSNLAAVLQHQGKYEEAETLQRRALEEWKKRLGEDHPDTLRSLGNLAVVLREQGKYAEAETLNRRAIEGSEKKLGQDHPDTLRSVRNLAHLLHTLRQYSEAAELYQRACDGSTKKLGSQHPSTIKCRTFFANMRQEARQARLAEGEGLSPGGSEPLFTTGTHEKDV
jgi:tetratricopeptide (TPR) repeat protein